MLILKALYEIGLSGKECKLDSLDGRVDELGLLDILSKNHFSVNEVSFALYQVISVHFIKYGTPLITIESLGEETPPRLDFSELVNQIVSEIDDNSPETPRILEVIR